MENVPDERKERINELYGSALSWIKRRHEQFLQHLSRQSEELKSLPADSPWSRLLGKLRITPSTAHDVALAKLSAFTFNDKDEELLKPLYLFGFAEYFLDFEKRIDENTKQAKGSERKFPILSYTKKEKHWIPAVNIAKQPHIALAEEVNRVSYSKELKKIFDGPPPIMTDGLLEMARAIGMELIDLFAIVAAPSKNSKIGDPTSGVSYQEDRAFIFNLHDQSRVSVVRDSQDDQEKDDENPGARMLALKISLEETQRWLPNVDYVVWAIPTTLSQEPFVLSTFKVTESNSVTDPLIVRFSTIFARAQRVMVERSHNLATEEPVSVTTAQAVVQQGLHEAGYYRSIDDTPTRTLYAVGAWRSAQQLFFRRIVFLMSLGVPRSQCTIHKDYVARFSMPGNEPTDSDRRVPSGEYQNRFTPLAFWQALKVVLCARERDQALEAMLEKFDSDRAWFASSIKHTSSSKSMNIYANLVSKLPLPALHLLLEGTLRFLQASRESKSRPYDTQLSPGLAHQATHLFTWFRDLTPLVLLDMETRIADESKFYTEGGPQAPGGGQLAIDIAIPIDGPLDLYWENCVRTGPPYVPVDDPQTLASLKSNPMFPMKLILAASIRENATRYLRYMDISIDMLGERSWRTGSVKIAPEPYAGRDLGSLIKHYADHHLLMGEARHHRTTLVTANNEMPQVLDPYDLPNERARLLYAYARYAWFKWHRPKNNPVPKDDGPERLAMWQVFLEVEIDPLIPEMRELTQIAMLMGDTLFFPLVFDTIYSATPAPFNTKKWRDRIPQHEALLYLLGWLDASPSQKLVSTTNPAAPLFEPYKSPDDVSTGEVISKLESLQLYDRHRQGYTMNYRKIPLAVIYNVHNIDDKIKLPYDAHTTMQTKLSPNDTDEWAHYTVVRNGEASPDQFKGPSSGLGLAITFKGKDLTGQHAVELPSLSFVLPEYMRNAAKDDKSSKSRGVTNYFSSSSLRQAAQHRLGEAAINRYQTIVPIQKVTKKGTGASNDNLLFKWPSPSSSSSSQTEIMHPLLHAVRLFLGHRYLPSTPVFDASLEKDDSEATIISRNILHYLMRFSLIMGRADTSNAMENLMADAASLLIMWEANVDSLIEKLHWGSDPSIALDTPVSRRIISAEPARLGWRIEWNYANDKLLTSRGVQLLTLFGFDESTTLDGVNLLQGMMRDVNAHVCQVPLMALHTLARAAFPRYLITQEDVDLTPRDLALRCGWIGLNPPMMPEPDIERRPLRQSIEGIDEKLRPRPFVVYAPLPPASEGEARAAKKRKRSTGKRQKKEPATEGENKEEKTDDILETPLNKLLEGEKPPKKKRRLSNKQKQGNDKPQPTLIDLVDDDVDGMDITNAIANQFKQILQEDNANETAKKKQQQRKLKKSITAGNFPPLPPNVLVFDEDEDYDDDAVMDLGDNNNPGDTPPITPRNVQQEPADEDDEDEESESSLSLLGDSFSFEEDDDSNIDDVRNYITNMRRGI